LGGTTQRAEENMLSLLATFTSMNHVIAQFILPTPIVQCWPRIARQWAEKKGDIDLRPALLSYLVSNLIQDGFAATAAGVTNPIGSVTAAIADAQLTAIGVTCA
jgi:hypothetical protein